MRLRVAGDVAVSLAVLALALPQAWTPVSSVVLTVATAAALLVRRARPVVVTWVVLGLTVVTAITAGTPPALAGVLVALYTVAATHPLRPSVTLAGIAASAVATVAVWVALTAGEGPDLPGAATAAGLVAGAWALGALLRSRQQTVTALRARADLVERDRDLRVDLAIERERARIMRDMHDVVGHSLSVIAVQADAARAVLDRDTAQAGAALDRIGVIARDALSEVRAVIQPARDDSGPDGAAGHDLSRLDDLVGTTREAGTLVRLTVDGDVAALSAAQSATAFRIVQESLTNARRHAGPGGEAHIRITVADTALHVAVRSTGRARDTGHEPARAGTGIAAMRERTAMLGGTLHAGWVSETSFEVSASVPLGATAYSL